MSLIKCQIRSNEIKDSQWKNLREIYKFRKTADYPMDSFSGIKRIQEKETNLKTRLKNIFSKFFKKKSNPYQKPEPARIQHKANSKPIIKGKQTYNYIDCDNGRILKRHNPQTLKRAELPKNKTVLNVSNFDYPYGSISASTKLDDCIATGDLRQCAGVAIVDKQNNMQTLIHCYPGQSKEDIAKLLEHSVSRNNKDVDITVITGTDDFCDMTISSIVDSLKEITPKNKIKFANFSKEVDIFDRAVVLENGKLTCCSSTELKNLPNKVTNPEGEISYIVDSFNS